MAASGWAQICRRCPGKRPTSPLPLTVIVPVWSQCGCGAITSIRHGMVPFSTSRTAAYAIKEKPDKLVAALPGYWSTSPRKAIT